MSLSVGKKGLSLYNTNHETLVLFLPFIVITFEAGFWEMLILGGPTAAGKNTIGHLVARQRQQCAVIDFDDVRNMFVKPHRPPWDGEAGRQDQLLGVELVCGLAIRFARAGWDVVVLDVVMAHTAPRYRELLAEHNPIIVQLLPHFAENRRRFLERGRILTDDEFLWAYKHQIQFADYDWRIDNTNLSSKQVAQQIIRKVYEAL